MDSFYFLLCSHGFCKIIIGPLNRFWHVLIFNLSELFPQYPINGVQEIGGVRVQQMAHRRWGCAIRSGRERVSPTPSLSIDETKSSRPRLQCCSCFFLFLTSSRLDRAPSKPSFITIRPDSKLWRPSTLKDAAFNYAPLERRLVHRQQRVDLVASVQLPQGPVPWGTTLKFLWSSVHLLILTDF